VVARYVSVKHITLARRTFSAQTRPWYLAVNLRKSARRRISAWVSPSTKSGSMVLIECKKSSRMISAAIHSALAADTGIETYSTGLALKKQRRVKRKVRTLTEALEIARGRTAEAVAKSSFEQSVEPVWTVMATACMRGWLWRKISPVEGKSIRKSFL